MSFASLETILAEAASRLHAAGVESPRREARLLLAHAIGVRQEDIIAERATLTAKNAAAFETVLARRIAREPFAYIIGSREFWSIGFAVGPGVLVPRPETEILVDSALRRFPALGGASRVLDLGTGSGCLLLSFLSERPNASGIGVDISEDALAFARRNAKVLGLEERAEFVPSDWAENISGVFDAIFVNPPYIRKDELAGLDAEIERYEPRAALDGGIDGLDAYRRLAKVVPEHLSAQGLAFFEVGQGQAELVADLLAQAGFVVEESVCDLSSISRCLVVCLDAPPVQPKKVLALETRSG